MKTKLLGVMIGAFISSFAWGNPAPSVCNFGDPLFESLSHQAISIETPKEYKVGEENFVIIHLEKPDLPSGYRVTVLVDTLESPSQKPEIQGWYPKTSIKPLAKGKHVLTVRVNLVYKSSCGGILVASLANTTLTFTAK